MAKLNKAGAKLPLKKRAYKKRSEPVNNTDDHTGLFQIEETPPPPAYRASVEKLQLLDRLERTLKNVKPGQAFIVPSAKRETLKRYLRINYPEDKFVFAHVHDNPDAMRVYRYELAKPKSKK